MAETIFIPAAEMQETFFSILLEHHFSKDKALACAEIFTSNSVDGVYTHGVNRFPRFVQYVKEGLVLPDAEPTLQHSFGGLEQWNGNLAAGTLNAIDATNRAMQLATEHGIGCVAMANTNHWMRGGYYGWQAAKKGFVFIGWTNTIGNMPAWNAIDNKLGNNPIVFALPFNDEAIVMDMAMSQFSFGTMEQADMRNEKLPVFGGFDNAGALTDDPSKIIESKRPLPIGYWKGAGLSLVLDILGTILSAGMSTNQITERKTEHGVSQVFIAIDLSKLSNFSIIATTIEGIINDYQQSVSSLPSKKISYPGERVLESRKINIEKGIPVLKTVWDEILNLHNRT